MMVLVIGGSGSGKSAYAEAYLTELSGDLKRYYIATMQVLDREGEDRVERHRRMRSGRGFCTLEQTLRIEEALPEIGSASGSTALVECMSNLTANEMFSGGEPKTCEEVTERILRGIGRLNSELRHLVVVSNNVFEDGIGYDALTMEYIRAMGSLNAKLAAMADRVIEVVVGIPVVVKEGI